MNDLREWGVGLDESCMNIACSRPARHMGEHRFAEEKIMAPTAEYVTSLERYADAYALAATAPGLDAFRARRKYGDADAPTYLLAESARLRNEAVQYCAMVEQDDGGQLARPNSSAYMSDADSITTFSDADLDRMVDSAWLEAARCWQVARARGGTRHGDGSMLYQAAESAEAYFAGLKAEQQRRNSNPETR